jgi:hypothetical protein
MPVSADCPAAFSTGFPKIPNQQRGFKIHLAYEFFAEKIEKEGLKAIVIMRNPKDTLVSFLQASTEFDIQRRLPRVFRAFPGEEVALGRCG